MNKTAILLIALMVCSIGLLSGCVRETPISEGNVSFSIENVIVTSELEIYDSWTNETGIIISNTSKIVIVSITIENEGDKLLEVMESFTDGLTDDEGNTYFHKMYVELNDSSYAVKKITSIEEEELFDDITGISTEISPDSTELKKIVYQIPIDREPDRLRLSYGFKANELTNVEKWYHTYLELQ